MRQSIADTDIFKISVVHMENVNSDQVNVNNPMTSTMEISNYTSKIIYVSTRDGLIHEIQPQHLKGNAPGPCIVVRTTYKGLAQYVRLDAKCKLNEPNSEYLENLRNSSDTYVGPGFNTLSANRILRQETLNENSGITYIPELDIQISNNPLNQTPPHPFSGEGKIFHDIIDNAYFESTNHVAIAMDLIDNSGILRTMYISVLGNIYMLTPVRDISRTDGLYITKNGLTSVQGKRNPVDVERIPISEIKARFKHVYSTPGEAIALGSAEQQEELELQRREHEIKREEQELKIRKAELEKETLALKEKLENQQQRSAYDKLKYESERMRWDERKHRAAQNRKETLEIMKIIPAVITVGLTIYGIYLKNK